MHPSVHAYRKSSGVSNSDENVFCSMPHKLSGLDFLKPAKGSWSCKVCYTLNTAVELSCVACESPKETTDTQTDANKSSNEAPKSMFTYGAQSEPIDEEHKFRFVFAPKSPVKDKNVQIDETDDASDNDNVEDEENNTYFTPVIPLPDKIEVRTGEEDEEVLYSHRAKLYRFKNSEWRARGLGDVKILRHKVSGRLRVVMRREQILKICLNHILDNNVIYKSKDPKSLQFIVNDFSEGEFDIEQLCLRFKTPEIAQEFKNAINGALDEATSEPPVNIMIKSQLPEKSLSKDEIVINDYRLPSNFFDYKNHPDCSGCCGCNSDDFQFPKINEVDSSLQVDTSLPLIFTPLSIKNDAKKSTE